MSTPSGFDDSWSLGGRSLADDPESATVGADVAELQRALLGLGYDLSIDGNFGPTTADEVRRFQEHRGLVVDGVFGPVTFRELLRILDLVARPINLHGRRDR